jgi:hypothetical protein
LSVLHIVTVARRQYFPLRQVLPIISIASHYYCPHRQYNPLRQYRSSSLLPVVSITQYCPLPVLFIVGAYWYCPSLVLHQRATLDDGKLLTTSNTGQYFTMGNTDDEQYWQWTTLTTGISCDDGQYFTMGNIPDDGQDLPMGNTDDGQHLTMGSTWR